MASAITPRSQELTAALQHLRDRLGNATPVLMALGEDMTERIKLRFSSATAPDGSRWRPNTQTTIIRYIQERGGFSSKTGKVSAKGQKLAIAKRPLQGLSGDLASKIYPNVRKNSLLVGSTMVYAAMQHFGGTTGQFHQLWGNIPARPFLPITQNGELYPNEADLIIDRLREYLQE